MSDNANHTLNNEQMRAVLQLDGPILIIAGAGSGKTRTLTHRIAHLLNEGVEEKNILALTFTNKAAREMVQRLKSHTGRRLPGLSACTFHAFGVRLLRRYGHHLGLRKNFTIYDQADRQYLVKGLIQESGIPVEELNPYAAVELFSGIKTGRLSWSGENSGWKQLYQSYVEHLSAYNGVDFDDLIAMPIRLFGEHPECLMEQRELYRYILVDEFQDTSTAQYKIVQLLALKHRNLCVVGDDDQSIYSWRGASYQNIVDFERDFPERLEIKLEQNYRSTQHILSVANHLIAHNTNRKEKALWSQNPTESDRTIEITYPESEIHEGQFIAGEVRRLAGEGVRYHDIGILLRTNRLMAPVEEALMDAQIPYSISGGTSFFQRKEVKDLLAYLRVITNPDDDVNLLRVINTPRRGIGVKSLSAIRQFAEHHRLSLFSAISDLRITGGGLPAGVCQSLKELVAALNSYQERFFSGRGMAETLRTLIDHLGFWEHLMKEHPNNDKVAEWRYRNLFLLADMLERWCNSPDNSSPSLLRYLEMVTLIQSGEEEEIVGKVNLMTIHSAKGLEFDTVFLAGVEERIIPHLRAIEENPDNLEEERRLFYVALTRARRKLFISACRRRNIMRKIVETGPSQFLQELPQHLVVPHKVEEVLDDESGMDAFAKIRAKLDALGSSTGSSD